MEEIVPNAKEIIDDLKKEMKILEDKLKSRRDDKLKNCESRDDRIQEIQEGEPRIKGPRQPRNPIRQPYNREPWGMNKTGVHNNRAQLDGKFNPTPVPQNSQMNPTYQPRYQEPYREITPTFRREYAPPFPAPQIHPNERLLGNRPAPVQNQPLRDPIRN